MTTTTQVTSADLFEDERKRRLLDWLLMTPALRAEQGLPKSQREMAMSLGVSPRTIRDWQSLPQFRGAWEKESKELIGTPDKVQRVLEALYAEAVDDQSKKQVQAAKLYLEAVDAIQPPKVDVAAKRAAEMSDAELQAMIAQLAQAELAARGSA